MDFNVIALAHIHWSTSSDRVEPVPVTLQSLSHSLLYLFVDNGLDFILLLFPGPYCQNSHRVRESHGLKRHDSWFALAIDYSHTTRKNSVAFLESWATSNWTMLTGVQWSSRKTCWKCWSVYLIFNVDLRYGHLRSVRKHMGLLFFYRTSTWSCIWKSLSVLSTPHLMPTVQRVLYSML